MGQPARVGVVASDRTGCVDSIGDGPVRGTRGIKRGFLILGVQVSLDRCYTPMRRTEQLKITLMGYRGIQGTLTVGPWGNTLLPKQQLRCLLLGRQFPDPVD